MAEDVDYAAQQETLKVCVLCAGNLKEKTPKLLPCLHSLCDGCLNTLFKGQDKQGQCKDEVTEAATGGDTSSADGHNQNKSVVLNTNDNSSKFWY